MIANRLATVFIIFGLIAIFAPFIYTNLFKPSSQNNSSDTVEASSSAQTSAFGPVRIAEALTKGVVAAQPPTRIIIPKVNIDLPVTESRMVNGYWEVSEVTASHGMGSSYPGQIGNTVIFAHARQGLFLPLRKITINDRIYILTNDHWHRYRVTQKTEVLPAQVQFIKPTSDETLTLFTCSGFLDSKRLVVVATPDR